MLEPNPIPPSWRNTIPRLLITGGSGFIGTNAVAFALRAGVEVQNIDLAAPKDASHSAVWRRCDILDQNALSEVVAEFDPTHVLHLAARTDLRETRDISGYRANTDGVSNLIKALQNSNAKRVIFTSSMLVCRNGHRPSANDEYCPDTLYGESKVLGEALVRRLASNYVWTIVRPTSIWGPWFGAPYRNFFESVARGLYRNPGSETVVKALGYVENTVWQLFHILAAPTDLVACQTFYVSDYQSTPVRDWARAIALHLGAKPVKDLHLGIMRAAALAGDIVQMAGVKNPPLTRFRMRNMLTSSSFNFDALEHIAGPLPYTMDEGVRATVKWLAGKSGESF